MREVTKNNILIAKKALNDGDPQLAVFVLRDLEDTKEKGLSDLAWAMYQEGCCRNDVEYLIEKLSEDKQPVLRKVEGKNEPN